MVCLTAGAVACKPGAPATTRSWTGPGFGFVQLAHRQLRRRCCSRRAAPRRDTMPARATGLGSADPSAVELDAWVALANRLADRAGEVCRRYYRTPVAVDVKADASPVTAADREAEAAMRRELEAVVPEHGVLGEEYGISLGQDRDWTWVLDPVDGTKSFITGRPLFGTLIALCHRGVPVLGILDQPILRERWVGVAGRPTLLNGRPVRTRACGHLKDAYLFATSPHMFHGATEAAFNRVRDAVRLPQYGCDCYAYGLVALGLVDLVAEADMKPYDFLALVPIVQGAGGAMTDWSGEELRLDVDRAAAPHEVLAAGDADAHAQALNLLRWGRG